MFSPLQAMAARLEALENDAAVQDTFAAGSDDEEFVLREDSEGGEHLLKFAFKSPHVNFFLLSLHSILPSPFVLILSARIFKVNPYISFISSQKKKRRL
jgi:hypothetical protein